MNYRFSSVDRSKEYNARQIMNSLHLGGSLILGRNDFDINNYLIQSKNITNSKTINTKLTNPSKNKYKLSLLNTKYMTPKIYEIYTKKTELSTLSNKAFSSEKESKEKDLYEFLKTESNTDNKSTHFLNISQNPNSSNMTTINNTLFSPKLKTKKAINVKNVLSPLILKTHHNEDSENFNALKVIKNIKENITKFNNENKNADYFKKIPIYRNKIPFHENYEKIVFDANKMINNHRTKESELNIDDIDLNDFILKNKKISINNVLIEIMKNKNKQLKTINEVRVKNIKNFEKIIEEDEQNFEDMTLRHLNINNKINDLIKEIYRQKSNLVNLLYIYTVKNESLEDTIFKTIEQIESLRKYAKFVHRILGDKEILFEKELIPNYENNGKPDIHFLINEVYDIYGHLLEGKKRKKNFELKLNDDEDDNENENKNEKKYVDDDILSDPYLMIRKFKELEDKIIRYVKRLENFNKIKFREQEEKDEIIKDLKERISKLEKEYEFEKNMLTDYKNRELGDNSNNNMNEDYYRLADNLCKKIYQIFNHEKNPKKHMNNNSNSAGIDTWEINEDITKCMKIMVKKEQLVNKLIGIIESLEKEDVNLFNEIMSKKKLEIKTINQIKIREKVEKNLLNKKLKANEKFNKIVVKLRKAEPSKHLEKKEVKVKINEKDIIKKENEDLLIYD